jgi:hypothetical protein
VALAFCCRYLSVDTAMIACEPAATSACTGEAPHPAFRLFDQCRPLGPSFCPRTVEILTMLNDVFDSLAPGEGGTLATDSA